MQTPKHYDKPVSPWDLERHMESSGNAFVDSRRTDAIEYLFRIKEDMLEDMKKARHCIDSAIEVLEKEQEVKSDGAQTLINDTPKHDSLPVLDRKKIPLPSKVCGIETGQPTLGSGTCSALLEHGKEFRFNDHVCIEMLIGVPIEKRTGRLVQVRKGRGQFGSCIYFLRRRDGSLAIFENAMIRHVDDEQFVDSFYRLNGKEAPVIPDQSPVDSDSETATYTIGGKWPETGFIVEAPKQPEASGCFSMAIFSLNVDRVATAYENQSNQTERHE